MYWLNMTWITENWAPLLVTLVLGFVLGWLLTGMSPARRARDLKTRNAVLEDKQRKTELDLSDSRSAYTKVNASLTTTQAELEAARAKSTALDEKVAGLEAEAAKAAEVAKEQEEEAAEAKQEAEAAKAAEVAAAQAAEDAATDELPAVDAPTDDVPAVDPSAAKAMALATAFGNISERFTTVARTSRELDADRAREVALTEAYNRVARLQDELDQRDASLAERDAELNSTKAELLTSNAARHELDNRLIRAREDVAAELAVLASTMIKMKDDALARAEIRNAALLAELDAMRTGRSADSE